MKRKFTYAKAFQGSSDEIKRSRIRLQLVLCADWDGNTGCLVAQDLALLTKVRTLIHEEISLLTVLTFPFGVEIPLNMALRESRIACR
jgi:hypothetical protein